MYFTRIRNTSKLALNKSNSVKAYKNAAKLGKKFTAALFLCVLSGCSTSFNSTLASANNNDISPFKSHLARLIIVRPREALLSISDRNPVELYLGSHKIAEIPHGHFIELESPELPSALTIHWFDKQHPKISRTINLNLGLQPGDSQIVQLKMEQETLVAHLVAAEDEAKSLAWVQKHNLTSDLAEALAQSHSLTPTAR